MVRLELPYPPSVNHYWRHARGRTYIADHGKIYRRGVAMAAMNFGGPIKGRLAVTVTLWERDRRRRDIDNACKALLDALAHAGVYEDDSQIDDLRVIRGEPEPRNPHIVVEILELAP